VSDREKNLFFFDFLPPPEQRSIPTRSARYQKLHKNNPGDRIGEKTQPTEQETQLWYIEHHHGEAPNQGGAVQWATRAQRMRPAMSKTNGGSKASSADIGSIAAEDLVRFTQTRRFATILADPPWQFTNKTGKVAPEHKRLARYGTMKLDKIMAMPVAELAAP